MVHRLVIAAVFLGAGLVASAQGPVEKGREVYAANKCGMCHSVADAGNKKGPLDGVGAKLSADEIREWIVAAKQMTVKTGATRKPPMKDFGNLATADVDALVAYLRTLKTK
jgi:mono/diheme cytochrome c family protein